MAAAAAEPLSRRVSQVAARVSPWFVYAAGFLPLAWIIYLTLMDRLGADPTRELEHRLGLWGLRFLIITLCITPLRQLTKVSLLRFRRALGLLAFWYAALHFTVYLVLDQQLDLAAIWTDIFKRYYITIGFAAFLILVGLALTSNRLSIRKLGARWTQVHKLIYVAIALGAIHFLMSVKSWPAEPVIYALIVLALLAWRFVPQRRTNTGRDRPSRPPQAATGAPL